MTKKTINLGTPYHAPGTIVISGRPKGSQLRNEFNLDKLDSEDVEVTVEVPAEVISLNSSFFLGLFAPSVKKLGIEGFESKYKFNCNPEVLDDIESGKREALNTANPLGNPK